MNPFELWKKNALTKIDKSNKGSIDKPIKNLIDLINKSENYFTTSSCSGRVVLLIEPESGVKKDVSFLFCSHEKITIDEINKALEKIPQERVWFRYEGLILHIVCKTLDHAQILLKKIQPQFKHSGIMTTSKKFVVEVRGTAGIETPISENNELLVTKDYINILINQANKKFDFNSKKILSVEQIFS